MEKLRHINKDVKWSCLPPLFISHINMVLLQLHSWTKFESQNDFLLATEGVSSRVTGIHRRHWPKLSAR